jgi:Putative bacterial sensory transduction regulator
VEIILTPETISYDVIAGICDAADYTVTTLDDGSLRIGVTTTVFVRLSPKNDRMQVATYRGFADSFGAKERSDFLRSVNDESPLLKARLSNSGAFMIAYEHCVVGGVTAENLLAVIERTAVLCADLMAKYSGNFK